MKVAAPTIRVRHHKAVSAWDRASRGRDRYGEQRTSVDIADLTPIEPRVRDHDFKTADKQSEKAEERDPVCRAHECGMPREIRFGVRVGG